MGTLAVRLCGRIGRHVLRPAALARLGLVHTRLNAPFRAAYAPIPSPSRAMSAFATPLRHLSSKPRSVSSRDTPPNSAPEAQERAAEQEKSSAPVKEPFVLQLFPGRTPVRKAATAALTAAACLAAVRTGLYVPSDETIALAAFVLVVRTLHVLLRGPFVAAARAYIEGLYDAITMRREDAERDVVAGVARLRSYADAADVAATVFGLRRAIPGMEAALGDARRRAAATEAVRVRLDAAVRAADERRRVAAIEKHAALVRALHERLADPGVQARILSNAIKSLARAQPMP